MKLSINQYSFAAGELSPRLLGRSDLQKYASGAAFIENFIVRPEGGVMRRHGTRFAGEVRDSTKRTRLIPFVFSTVQAYMLEFSDRTIRVWKDGAIVAASQKPIADIARTNPARVMSFAHGFANGDRVLIAGVRGLTEVNNREFTVANADIDSFELAGLDAAGFNAYLNGGTVSKIYEIASPYTEAELHEIAFAQSADVLYLVHKSHAPRLLTRSGHAQWTLTPQPLQRGPFASANPDDARRLMCIGASSYQPGAQVTVKANAPVFTPSHAGSYLRLQELYLADQNVSPWSPAENLTAALGTQVSSNGHVYALIDAGSGAQTGTVAPSHTEGDAWDNPSGAANRKKWRYLHSRWVILRLDSFLDQKTMQATAMTYLPSGLAPATKTLTSVTSASGRIRVTATAHGFDEGDYVQIAGVNGAVQANGDWKITNVTANTFDLENAGTPSAYVSGGTVRRFATWLWSESAFSLARGYPSTVALHEQRLVFANTLAQPFGLWASASADFTNFLPGTNDDETIAYNIAASQADPIRWLASGSDLLIGTLSQEFAAFGGGLGDPVTPSNMRIVPQSGEGANHVQPVRAGTGTIFVNRSGRRLFDFNSSTETGVYTSTDLSELSEHLTRRSPVIALAWAKNPLSLLWALREDGKVLSLTYRPEQQIYAWSQHDFGGKVESIAVTPSPTGATDDLWMIVQRTVNGVPKRYVEILAPPFEPEAPNDKDSMGFLDCALRYVGPSVAAVAGLYHLEGETVTVVANGAVHPAKTVQAGAITLNAPAGNVWVGLNYESRVRSLPIEAGSIEPLQGKVKRLVKLIVRLHNSIGGEAGPADNDLSEPLLQRDQADPMDASPPLRSADAVVFPASDFTMRAGVVLRQREPLPLDILSVTPVLAVAA